MKIRYKTASMMKTALLINALGLIGYNTFADDHTFQTIQDVAFTFEPSVTVSITGGDLTISNLAPGSSSDSNIITVSASSNALHGYTLTSTVGSSSNTSAELRRGGTETASGHKFSSLTANKAALANFSDSDWGYSYSTDSGSTWVSGDVGSTSSGYNGYTYSGSSSSVTHVSTSSNGSSSIKYKIGAKASGIQVAGEYTNVINFIGTGKVVTTSYTISYNANGGSGAPANQTGSTTNGSVNLSSTIPTKTDYKFKGWCTIDNTSDPTACSGTIVQPGGLMALNSGTSASVTKTVYAVWGSNIAEPELIEFTIQIKYYASGTGGEKRKDFVFHAEDGMSWEQWTKSDYNTVRQLCIDNGLTCGGDESGTILKVSNGILCGAGVIGLEFDGAYYTSYIDTEEYIATPGNTYIECNGGSTACYETSSDIIQANGYYLANTTCLTGDHLVTMGNGSLKRLDQIRCGDMVKSFDWDTMQLISKKVIYTDADEGKSHTEYDEWTFDDGTVIKTVHRHEFYNAEAKRFKYMDEWSIGERSYKIDNTKPVLVSHRLVKKTVRHYKITLEGGTNYFANGLLTGDRYNPKKILL